MKKEHFDDTKTIRLLAGGSEHAFTLIFDRYQAKVYRAAYKILKSRPLAEEIVQEVFLKVWARRIAFPEIRSLEAFLYTSARNLTIDYLITKAVSTIRETLKPHIGYTFLPLLLDVFKER
jgi:RNA polymerase sigma factor (sigma-70 family)